MHFLCQYSSNRDKIHTFAVAKPIVELNKLRKKGMKKIVVLALGMFFMTASLFAQKVNKEVSKVEVPNYARVSKYLLLNHKQEKDLYPLMQQLYFSVENSINEKDQAKAKDLRNKAVEDNKAASAKVLDKDQHTKYVALIQNTLNHYNQKF